MFGTRAPEWSILVRLLVGLVVFFPEGIQKLALPDILGAGRFHLPKLARYGFWSMLHEARADFDMLLGSLYLVIEGAGAWSLDATLADSSSTIWRLSLLRQPAPSPLSCGIRLPLQPVFGFGNQ